MVEQYVGTPARLRHSITVKSIHARVHSMVEEASTFVGIQQLPCVTALYITVVPRPSVEQPLAVQPWEDCSLAVLLLVEWGRHQD